MTLPRYFLEIDEEGFPHFSGVRVQDEALLEQLIGGVRRLVAGNPSSPLVTDCEGELCWIDAFDAPLVAQSIEGLGDSASTWVFPGGRRAAVAHAQLEVDDWHRLHAWLGEDKIPAVLSRKAQAAFLQGAPLDRLPQPLPKFRECSKNNVNEAAFWTQAYINKNDGWELGAPTPALESEFAAVRAALPARAAVAVPGAGRGHDAEYLARQGFAVTAVDFSTLALDEFKRLYPSSRVSVVESDVFEFLRGQKQAYDGIFEHTIFCAIQPARRREFLEAVGQALKPGALYFGVFFVRTGPGGPPYGVTPWELRELTRGHFDVRAWKRVTDSPPSRQQQELWAVFSRAQ